jgi:DnaJ-class molecular chaperone
MKSKDLYDTLGLSKEATENDIWNAYEKLVFQIHPDKENKCPGAADAFKGL